MLDREKDFLYNTICKVNLFYTFGFDNMEKDLSLTELFDIYGCLLTERQRELFESYYLYDLSLAEIAEPEGKTRQNVYAAVKSVKDKLREYENLLRLKEKSDELNAVAESLAVKDATAAERIKEIIGK